MLAIKIVRVEPIKPTTRKFYNIILKEEKKDGKSMGN